VSHAATLTSVTVVNAAADVAAEVTVAIGAKIAVRAINKVRVAKAVSRTKVARIAVSHAPKANTAANVAGGGGAAADVIVVKAMAAAIAARVLKVNKAAARFSVSKNQQPPARGANKHEISERNPDPKTAGMALCHLIK
jgi:hypothetical protein